MILTIIISIITFLLIILSILFFPKIKIKNVQISLYWIIPLIAAFLLLVIKCVPFKYIIDNGFKESSINPIKILVLFFSMTFLSIFLDELGLFKHIALYALKKAKNRQISIFLVVYAFAAIVTVFTSNDIVILTLTPFICMFCKHAKINPIPYLIGEFVAANTYSMILIIGNPTNIYLATKASISFITYFKTMILPTLACAFVELLIIFFLFRKDLKKPIEKEEGDYPIDNKVDLVIGLIIMFACLLFLVISNYLHLGMWLISLIAATVLLVYLLIKDLIVHNFKNLINTLKRLPYQLIPFIISMFIIVSALEYQGITLKISELLNGKGYIFKVGISSFFASNLINNIPMSIMYSSIVSNYSGIIYLKASYAAIIGSNLGAFLTPIGALAGIMFTDLINKYEVKFSFLTFIKYGVLISIPVLVVALFVLSFVA